MHIVWIAGWGHLSNLFDSIAASFPDHNHLFPNFQSVTKAEAFLPALQDQLPTDEQILIGWSLGGMLALEAAEACASNVIGVVAIGTTVRFVNSDPNIGWTEAAILDLQKQLTENPARTVEKFIRSTFTKAEIKNGHYRDFIDGYSIQEKLDCGALTHAELSAGLSYLRRKDLARSVTELPCQVNWIHGNLDLICPLAQFERTQELLARHPNHRFKVIQGFGHTPFADAASPITDVIKEFINDVIH